MDCSQDCHTLCHISNVSYVNNFHYVWYWYSNPNENGLACLHVCCVCGGGEGGGAMPC